MSPPITSRLFGLATGAVILVVVAGAQIAKHGESAPTFDFGDHWVSLGPQSPYSVEEPELPPGQQYFAIPLNGQSPAMKQGQRIDVLYQDESDTTPALIVEDVPIHNTYKGCRDAYPNVQLLLAKEDAERLGLLRGDGGKLLIRFTERKVDVAEQIAKDQE